MGRRKRQAVSWTTMRSALPLLSMTVVWKGGASLSTTDGQPWRLRSRCPPVPAWPTDSDGMMVGLLAEWCGLVDRLVDYGDLAEREGVLRFWCDLRFFDSAVFDPWAFLLLLRAVLRDAWALGVMEGVMRVCAHDARGVVAYDCEPDGVRVVVSPEVTAWEQRWIARDGARSARILDGSILAGMSIPWGDVLLYESGASELRAWSDAGEWQPWTMFETLHALAH